MNKIKNKSKTLLRDIWFYAVGEGGTSISINGISSFAMIFYTQVLGLSAWYAGLALSITTFWDAVSDPIMGHISDNTKSKFGRRHIYMLIGGVLLSVSFFFIWYVPKSFMGNSITLFWYLLVVNLILRTSLTVFVVPYTALGFEVCTTYLGRSKLQGIRYFINMVVNLLCIACAWALFFQDEIKPDGTRIDGSMIYGNYLYMGLILAVVALVLTMLSVFLTKKYMVSSVNMETEGNSLKAFFKDIGSILVDKYALRVFVFLMIAQLGMMLTAQLQMYAYIDFMQLNALQKTFVHGGGMVSFAIGSLLIAPLGKWFEKKYIGYLGSFLAILGGILLFVVFTCNFLTPKSVLGGIPIAVIIFAIGQYIWWGGCGILIPLATSMIADVSEVNKIKHGSLKDGSYSAMFSFVLKASTSLGLGITGILLTFTGYDSGATLQTYSVAKNIASMTFIFGPILIFFAFFLLIKYPITRKFLEELRNNKHLS